MSAPYVGNPALGWPDVLRVMVWATETQPAEQYTLFRRVGESDDDLRQRAQARAMAVQQAHKWTRNIHIICEYDYDQKQQEADERCNTLLELRHTILASRDVEARLAAVQAMSALYGWDRPSGPLQ